jgi:ribose transport system permease protein
MNAAGTRAGLFALNNAPVALFGAVLAVFGLLSPSFLTPANLLNVLVQASSTAIVATGMTFVLLTAGVDLSVGSIMFVAAALGGKLLLGQGWSPLLVLGCITGLGAACGLLNAVLISRLGLIAFVATLGTQYLGRGFGMWLTETRAMNLPDGITQLAALRPLGVPLPLMVFAAVALAAHVLLSRTPLGRQIYAVGQDPQAARKAGVNVPAILAAVYVICGLCAGLGGAVSLAQIGSVAPTFGAGKEFAAIAAAVLGGTSLFGGRGRVWPGTAFGAVLIQAVENGLHNLNADPYLYPLVTGGIIFVAVFLDSLRSRWLARLGRRRIRHD